MQTISLACYSVRFREAYKKTPLKLDDARLPNLHKFFTGYFSGLKGVSINNEQTKKVLGARTIDGDHPNLEGLLVTGEYGYEAELVDVNGKKPRYRRGTDQAQMLPFYFRFYLPVHGDLGVLLLQRFGVLGVRTILHHDLKPKFEAAFPEISLDLWPQVPDGVLDQLLGKGGLKSITLRKHVLPADLVDKLDEDSPEAGKMDIVITAKNDNRFNSALKKVRDIVNGRVKMPLNEVVSVDGFEHDQTLLEIEIAGKPHTVNLSNLTKLRAHIDITKKVALGADGHPTFQSISREAAQVLHGIRKVLGI